jgi:hypothetical protein
MCRYCVDDSDSLWFVSVGTPEKQFFFKYSPHDWGTVLTSRKVGGSIPDENIKISIVLVHPHYGPGIDSASNWSEYQKSWGKGRPTHKSDNLTAIF